MKRGRDQGTNYQLLWLSEKQGTTPFTSHITCVFTQRNNLPFSWNIDSWWTGSPKLAASQNLHDDLRTDSIRFAILFLKDLLKWTPSSVWHWTTTAAQLQEKLHSICSHLPKDALSEQWRWHGEWQHFAITQRVLYSSGTLHGVLQFGEDLRAGSQGSKEVCWNKDLAEVSCTSGL